METHIIVLIIGLSILGVLVICGLVFLLVKLLQSPWTVKVIDPKRGIILEAKNSSKEKMIIPSTNVLLNIPSLYTFACAQLDEITLEPGQTVERALELKTRTELVEGKKYSYTSAFHCYKGCCQVSYSSGGRVRAASSEAKNISQQVIDMA